MSNSIPPIKGDQNQRKQMNWKLVCEIGFKVLTAAVAGAAVFVGISRSMTDSASGSNKPQRPETEPKKQQEPEKEPVVLTSMRATQDTCGKLFAFVQSLTMVTENLTRIFGGNTGPYIGSQPYYNDPWSYRQPVNTGNGATWTRISPFIIEAGPGNYPNSRGNSYPF